MLQLMFVSSLSLVLLKIKIQELTNILVFLRRSDNFSSSDVLSLSIFDAQRVMMMGSSKDLGWCKGT